MEFKKLSEVEIGTATEETHVLAEINGEIKRVPKNEVGGSASGVVFYFTPEDLTYFYKDVDCTEKATQADLQECIMAGSIVTLMCPMIGILLTPLAMMANTGGYGIIAILFEGNSPITLYTSEYVKEESVE